MNDSYLRKVVKAQINYTLGGWENEIADGERDSMPSKESLLQEVYSELMSSPILDINGRQVRVGKEIRFAGEKKIKELIEFYLEKEGV